MIQGVLSHCTEMEIERQCVDSHGQSLVAFAFCRLLGFELMLRLKGISRPKLCKAEAGQSLKICLDPGPSCMPGFLQGKPGEPILKSD